MPRGGGSSGRSSSGGGFSSHSRSSSSRSSGSSFRSSSSSSRSSGFSSSSRSSSSRSSGFSSHARSSSSRNTGRSSSYRSSYSGRDTKTSDSRSSYRSTQRFPGRRRTGTGRPGGLFLPLIVGSGIRKTQRRRRSAVQNLRRRSGCLGIVLAVLILILLIGAASNQTNSTVEQSSQRTPLDARAVLLSDAWYQDDWGDWIDACSMDERSKMIEDFRYFYQKTGIQPYLWILGENGASIQDSEALEQATRDRYDALFSDKGHLLIAFREYPNASGNYISGCLAGEDAERVMDAEAREVLLTNIDTCYDRTDYSEAQLFGTAVRKTADAIMQSPMSTGEAIQTLLGLGAVIFAFMLLSFFRGRKREQREAVPERSESVETQPVKAEAENRDPAAQRAVKCPNCGANTVMRLKTTGRCAYCGSYISMDEQGNATIAKV